MNQNLRWKCTCKTFETPNVRRVTTESLLKLCFYSWYKQKTIWISAVTLLLQKKIQPLEHIGTPMLVCPSEVCQKRNFDNFRLGAFFFIDIWYFNRVLSIYLGNTTYLLVKNTRILVRVYKTMENSKGTYNSERFEPRWVNVVVWVIVRICSVVLRRTVVGVTDVSTNWAEAIIRVRDCKSVTGLYTAN